MLSDKSLSKSKYTHMHTTIYFVHGQTSAVLSLKPVSTNAPYSAAAHDHLLTCSFFAAKLLKLIIPNRCPHKKRLGAMC